MVLERFAAGTYLPQEGYSCFMPARVNEEWTWSDPKLNALLARANLKLGELNAFSTHIPDIDMFIRMHVVKEATASSRIEGTRTAVEDMVMKKADVDAEKRDDWQEVHNYITAMNHAVRRLREVPVSTRLLRETHELLMAGVRGRSKLPGEYRRSQNWIGGATLRDAVFVPPPHTEMGALMGDLEKFLHNDRINVPDLVRIAIAHYQFETIHPFLDGNGRIGRLLIALYLVGRGILARPTLYLSAYIEKHRGVYYDNLLRVRTANDMLQWIRFFLVAVADTSQEGIETFRKILLLKEDIESRRLMTLGKRLPLARQLLSHLYRSPIVTAAEVGQMLNVTPATANGHIQGFVERGILRETTGGKRNRRFIFDEYLGLFGDRS